MCMKYGSRRNSPASSWFVHESQIRGQITTRPEMPRVSFGGTRPQRWRIAFLFILLVGLPAGLLQGPPCHQVHKLGTSVQSQKRHPQSSRRCLPFLSSRGEDVKPWMMWMIKTSMYYSQSMISSTQKTRITVSTRSIEYFHCVTSSRILYGRRGSQTLCQIRLIYCSTEQV